MVSRSIIARTTLVIKSYCGPVWKYKRSCLQNCNLYLQFFGNFAQIKPILLVEAYLLSVILLYYVASSGCLLCIDKEGLRRKLIWRLTRDWCECHVSLPGYKKSASYCDQPCTGGLASSVTCGSDYALDDGPQYASFYVENWTSSKINWFIVFRLVSPAEILPNSLLNACFPEESPLGRGWIELGMNF